MLAAFTTKLYNTGAQIHKKHKKDEKNIASVQVDKSPYAEKKSIIDNITHSINIGLSTCHDWI